MMKPIGKVFSLIISLLGLFACEDCIFSSRYSNEPIVRFYRKGSMRALAPSFDSVQTGKGITIYRSGRILYSSITSETTLPNSLALPLDPSRDTSAFIFFGRRPGAPANSLPQRDTLILRYRRILNFISPDCGYEQRIENLQILKNTYDSAQIAARNFILRSDTVHIRLFW
ncbi:MAG: DUF6452 family protein [Cytophagales bacterium]|nr:DUF6452 family protein [Bernardetiaceae bacterium]MDW8203748.1 DUF6452 family protein [Cytophagales bacterium]